MGSEYWFAVRQAGLADLVAILRVERSSCEAAHWPEFTYAQAITSPDQIVLVASQASDVLGFVIASRAASEWELENIAVSSAARRQGIGRALLEALIREARAAGATEIRQEIRVSNLAAQRLGQAVGFLQQGRRKEYYRDPQEDAILFSYLLKSPE
jgi:ribosomal-protein-alanine N-acetyltransferase